MTKRGRPKDDPGRRAGVRTVQGLGVSPGVAIGRALVIDRWQIDVPRYRIEPEQVGSELRRFHRARRQARREIEALRERTMAGLGARYAAIFDAHLMILSDRKLARETMAHIRDHRMNAEWALAAGVRRILRAFESVEDPYLRERGGDLADVHERLQRIFAGQDNPHARDLKLGEDTIVVASRLTPSDAAWLQQPGIAGFVTEEGGQTSHTAIIANALEIPALVGARGITREARNGETIVIDGNDGLAIIDPDPDRLAAYRVRRATGREAGRSAKSEGPVATADGAELSVAANIEFPEEMASVRRVGADGVGLYRSEFLYLSASPRLPAEEEHERAYRRIAREAAGATVVIRTLDLGGEKYFHEVLHEDRAGANPVLGLRAVRFCLRRPDIFRTQLRALLRVAWEHENVWIMFPMVSGVAEWREVRSFVDGVARELVREGHRERAVPLGPMIELPGAALLADRLAAESDFLSIGTNDLVQYTLAVDRGNREVAPLGDPWHPAVLSLIARVIGSARAAGKPVSLCGEMASDPLGALTLLGLGLRRFSCNATALPSVRAVLRRASSVAAREAVERALAGRATGAEIRAELEDAFRDLLAAEDAPGRPAAGRQEGRSA